MNGRSARPDVRLLNGLDDPSVSESRWSQLQQCSSFDSIFQTRWWLKGWWSVFTRGQLLAVCLFHDGKPACIAPLFADGGMVFPVGAGGSDYLDLIGSSPSPLELAEMLALAASRVSDFLGFRFYHLPDVSRTASLLPKTGEILGFEVFDEGDFSAPYTDFRTTGSATAEKPDLRRKEKYFRAHGNFVVRHFRSTEKIRARLDVFFDQHQLQWQARGIQSQFETPEQRRFFETLADTNPRQKPLIFTEINFEGEAIAFHFGFLYRNRFLWYKPSYDQSWAKRSPGTVLLRQLLLEAQASEASIFDFGLGDEPFKSRYATGENKVRTWGLYAPRN